MSRLAFRLHLLWITTASVILRLLVPPNPSYGSSHDDELVVVLARQIRDTGWLGDYADNGHLLLSKPPGYSMFLAYSRFLPWAPTVTIHLLLLVGFLVFLRELRWHQVSRSFIVGAYLFAAFFPAWFNEPMSRIYREGLLTALTALFLGASLWWARRLTDIAQVGARPLIVVRSVFAPSITVGLLAGSFVITKPSWHFLLVLVAGVAACYVVSAIAKSRLGSFLKVLGVSVLIVVISVAGPILFVMNKNHQNYGMFALDSFSQGGFARAMKILYSIEDERDLPYIDITKEMRSAAYRVSPTMAKLRAYLELPDGQGWRYQPCNTALAVCDESGAWFPWDFRDAVERAGLGDTPQQFDGTFHRIADEIERGCQRGTISCESKGLASALDSLDSLSPRIVANSMGLGAQLLLDPSLGFQARGNAVGVSEESKELWDSTIRGLPPRVLPTNYQSGTTFLSDVRAFLGRVYGAVWIPLLLAAGAGLVMAGGPILSRRNLALRVLALGMLGAIVTPVLQISMLEASNGFYMTTGASLYLLPVFPLMIAWTWVGLARFQLFVHPALRRRLSHE